MITERQAERLTRLIDALVGAWRDHARAEALGNDFSSDAGKAQDEAYKIQERLDKHIRLMKETP